MDVLEAIHTRRSTRTFTDAPVSPEQVETLLRAAMAAPSAHNGRPWRFVIVRDPDMLSKLAGATQWSAPMGRASVGIVVFADISANSSGADLWMLDCAAAAENLMLAAHGVGLGTVWLAVWPFEEYVDRIRTALGAPGNAVPIAMIALGVPERAPAEVDRFDASWIYAERYGEVQV